MTTGWSLYWEGERCRGERSGGGAAPGSARRFFSVKDVGSLKSGRSFPGRNVFFGKNPSQEALETYVQKGPQGPRFPSSKEDGPIEARNWASNHSYPFDQFPSSKEDGPIEATGP